LDMEKERRKGSVTWVTILLTVSTFGTDEAAGGGERVGKPWRA
jgi:hypothetical protein